MTATFIETLNQAIDADAERIAAMRAEIPSGVWLLLILVAAFGCITTSYGAGAEGTRSKLGSVFLPLLIAVVIVLIFDISHSRVDLIQVSQQPLVELQQSMTLSQ
jgi:membrane protein YdbS with pleckstrin-like domain